MIFKFKNYKVSKKISLNKETIDACKVAIIRNLLINQNINNEIENIDDKKIELIGETVEEINFLNGEYNGLSIPPYYNMINTKIINSSENPKTNTNISSEDLKLGILWINNVTGEVFTCIDNTLDKNIWIGQLGTKISLKDVTSKDNTRNGFFVIFKIIGKKIKKIIDCIIRAIKRIF